MTIMASPKEIRIHIRPFQHSWTKDFEIASQGEELCVLSVGKMLFAEHQASGDILNQSTRKLSRTMRTKSEIMKAVFRYEKQTSVLKKVSQSKNRATEGSYKVAQRIAKYGKPFTDEDYIKQAFQSCYDVLFDDLPSKNTIISRIKGMPVSARTVERRISEMATNVSDQQTIALKDAIVFNVALDECGHK